MVSLHLLSYGLMQRAWRAWVECTEKHEVILSASLASQVIKIIQNKLTKHKMIIIKAVKKTSQSNYDYINYPSGLTLSVYVSYIPINFRFCRNQEISSKIGERRYGGRKGGSRGSCVIYLFFRHSFCNVPIKCVLVSWAMWIFVSFGSNIDACGILLLNFKMLPFRFILDLVAGGITESEVLNITQGSLFKWSARGFSMFVKVYLRWEWTSLRCRFYILFSFWRLS